MHLLFHNYVIMNIINIFSEYKILSWVLPCRKSMASSTKPPNLESPLIFLKLW